MAAKPRFYLLGRTFIGSEWALTAQIAAFAQATVIARFLEPQDL